MLHPHPQQFKALGNKVTEGELEAIDLIDVAPSTSHVVFFSDEVTTLCPVTGAPDWYTVTIDLWVKRYSIESKSLKLFFQSFRNTGLFSEAFASQICDAVVKCTFPKICQVTVVQKARGGITISAVANYAEVLGESAVRSVYG